MGMAPPAKITNSMRRQQYTAASNAMEPIQSGPVKIRVINAKDGDGLIELSLDYEKAEVPSRAYFADYVDVLEGRADITLIFGRLTPGTTKLRSQVEISFSRDSFVSQVWATTREMHATLQKSEKRKLPPIESVQYSDMVHTSRANNVFMAALGEESILDFYYIAPSDIHFVRSGKRSNVNLEPVIRVSLPSPLVLEFLDKCGDMISKMPDAATIMKREEENKK
jgi:hypothetical protein